ncbi:anthrone oxygenase family protein [Streptomyces sp. MST-110588]|uniref:anthrone oxygenase family protein n=1 Tax=Streptomyces sp. MST-110588 TaxID=2833628 RepID=UPI001F5C48AE|nr:anthrone oxygenase family protein [Streptomyces sp. MST-110588]UNO40311.1 DUF1772 domain-containing protein [Streptomyces sp. MST-110588]
MYESIRNAALFAATATMGLSAGLFYAFACAVMPGLRQTDDRAFVEAMQRINVAIQNGWFSIAFGGALIFTVAAVALHLRADGRSLLPWLVAALVLYGVALGITFAVSIPLNDRLEAAGNAARLPDAALSVARGQFEAAWVHWNVGRAVASTGALACLVWALMVRGRS